MPWELAILNFDGKPPRLRTDADKDRELPLGALDEVHDHISAVLPAIEWYQDPPLIEMMKAAGSDSWRGWDAAMVADASRSKLRGVYLEDDLSLEMFGFEQDGPVRFVLLDVRGRKNPIPILKAICDPRHGRLQKLVRMASSSILLATLLKSGTPGSDS